MLRKCCVVFVASATMAFTSASFARADGEPYEGIKTAPLANQYVWSGLYVGIGGGGATFDSDISVEADRSIPDHPNFGDLSIISKQFFKGDDDWHGFGTVQVGYDHLIHDRVLIGAFADYDFSGGTKGRFSKEDDQPLILNEFGNPAFNPSFSFNGRYETEDVWTVGTRLGYLVNPRFLVYGLGGYSQLKIKGHLDVGYEDDFFATPLPSIKFDDRVHGFTVGGGAEVALHTNLSLKGEYRYSRFQGKSVSADGAFEIFGVDVEDKVSAKIGDINEHSLRVVLVLKLGDHDQRMAEPLK